MGTPPPSQPRAVRLHVDGGKSSAFSCLVDSRRVVVVPTHAAHEALFKPDFSILVQGTSMKRSHSAGLELPKSAFGSYTPLGMKHRLETINHTPTLLVISSLLRKVIDYDGCVYGIYQVPGIIFVRIACTRLFVQEHYL